MKFHIYIYIYIYIYYGSKPRLLILILTDLFLFVACLNTLYSLQMLFKFKTDCRIIGRVNASTEYTKIIKVSCNL
jgi:hypothetical protein